MQKRNKKILFFKIFIASVFIRSVILDSIPLRAQNYHDIGIPFIRNYTSDDYHAGGQNWDIVQDGRGVMYFANQNGVLEFDGKYWNLIELPNKSRVRSLALAPGGTIYVTATGEFGYLASDAVGKLAYVSLVNKLRKEDSTFYDVWDAAINPHGVHFITQGKIFRWHQDKITVIPLQKKSIRSATAYDEVFISFMGGDLGVLRDDKVIPLPGCGIFAAKEYGSIYIAPYPDKQLLILTKKGGFFLYNLKMLLDPGSKVFDFSKQDVPVSILKPLPTEISRYIDPDHNGRTGFSALTGNRFAVCTKNGGIIIMNKDGRLLQVINKKRGLKDDSIEEVYEDNNQNLWAAANTGLSYVETGSPISRFDDIAGLKGYVTAVTRFNGLLVAATFDNIFYLPRYRLKFEDDNHLFKPLSSLKSECWDFFQVKGNLLAMVRDELLQIDNTFNFKKYTGNTSYCLGWSPKFPNIIFIGLVAQGVGSFRMIETGGKGKNGIEFIYNGIFKGIDVSIRKIVADANGDLWLTSSLNGIFHIHFGGNSIENYRITHYTTAQGLPENNWNYVHYINNRLLVTTQKGLYECIPSPGTGKNKYCFVPEKTIGPVIPGEYRQLGGMSLDEKGTSWIISSSGIGTIATKSDGSYRWTSIPFKKIPHDAENIFHDREGLVWATSPRGLYRFDTTMPKNDCTPFNALIRKVTKGKNTVIFNGTYFAKHSQTGELFTVSSLSQPQELNPTVEYKNNSLTFEFSAAFYEQEQENRFKYMLEGFDTDWSPWTTQYKKEYTNLVEGKYRFRVQAQNIYEQQSREAVFLFTVSPPWYRTIPAYIAWILLIGSFMTGFVKLYLLHRESEKKIRESEEKFRVLAEKSVVGICIIQDNVVKYANPRLHEIFQYMPGQMEGKNLLDSVKEEDRSMVTLNLEMQSTQPLSSEAFEFRGKTAPGNIIYLEGRGTQTQYQGKSAFLETLIDISDRKKAEEELMQSKKLETVGILSGGIAHDFNNLLTIIMGNISLVKDNMPQPCERLDKYVFPMEKAVVQATDLVKNFMTLAAGGWIEFEKVSLTDILKNIGDETPQIKEIPYSLSIPWDLKPLHGDERKLRRVLSNLLINGYEAHIAETPNGTVHNKPVSITINAQNIYMDKNNPWNLAEGQYVKISVIDSGKGIPSTCMNKIFDPYFSTKQKGTRKGLGMGLAICNAIVKKHNGHITVSSEVDKGTIVDLFLPAG